MTKMRIVSAAAILLACASGCRLCERLSCGTLFPRAAAIPAPVVCPPVVSADPCDPVELCSPCDPCATPALPGPNAVIPEAESYVPAPIP